MCCRLDSLLRIPIGAIALAIIKLDKNRFKRKAPPRSANFRAALRGKKSLMPELLLTPKKRLANKLACSIQARGRSRISKLSLEVWPK